MLSQAESSLIALGKALMGFSKLAIHLPLDMLRNYYYIR